MAKTAPVRWDSHAIKAEVHRRGTTLRAIALAAGLDAGACSAAIRRRHIAGEHALAKYLGTIPEAIWPDRYKCPNPWAQTSLKKWQSTSQNGDALADMGAAA